MSAALNRVGRRLNVHDVAALEELDAAFRAWVAGRDGAILWPEDVRLTRAIAAVLHVELVEADPDE